jgi:hypothetical protein
MQRTLSYGVFLIDLSNVRLGTFGPIPMLFPMGRGFTVPSTAASRWYALLNPTRLTYPRCRMSPRNSLANLHNQESQVLQDLRNRLGHRSAQEESFQGRS